MFCRYAKNILINSTFLKNDRNIKKMGLIALLVGTKP